MRAVVADAWISPKLTRTRADSPAAVPSLAPSMAALVVVLAVD